MPIINDPDKFIQDETDPASLGVQPDFDMGNGAEPMPGTLTPDEAPMPTDTPPLEQEPDIGQNPFEDMEPSADPENTEYGLSEEKLDDIKQNVLKEIAAADNYYEEEIEPAVIKRHKIFDSDSSYYETKYPKLSKISDVTASDFHDTVEWAIPSLIKVFFGGEDICKLEGANSEQDDKAAKTHEELIKYQLERCNEGFLVFYDWIKNALVDNIGFIKCYWEREETIEQKHIMVTEEELMQMQVNPKINVLAVAKLGPGAISVDYEETTQITKNQPKLEVIPPSEFRFSPDAKNLEDIDFVAHRKIVTLDYLRRREREGIFQNIDKVVDEEGEGGAVSRTMYETDMNPMAYNKVADVETEDAKKEYLLYECYVKTDVNDDNILEDIIITIVGNTVVRLEENTMGRHPFFAISPIRDPLRLFPKRGIADLVGELQDLNTALLKQIISNVAINNDKQAFVNIDVLVDPNEFIDGRKAVRVSGDPSQAVKWSPIEPLPPSIFTFLENLQAMKETRTGITRYNQGLDASTLNKMLDIHTLVPMASGDWKELKDIENGDLIVGQNGKPTTVLKTHEIQYPKKAYEITFSNGDVIKAGGEHLWTIQNQRGSRKTVDTDYIYDYLTTYKQRLYVDKVNRPDFIGDIELPLDPYLLGLLLGDGCLHTNRITTEDSEVIDYVRKWAESNGGYVKEASSQNSGNAKTYDIIGTPLGTIMRDLKLRRDSRYDDMKNNEKHIPDAYFKASYKQRLSLLRGLMDTDGCRHSGSLCIFTQKEGQLVEDVMRLVESLGGSPTKHITHPGELAKPGVNYYNIHFSLNDCPFTLPRKTKKWKLATRMVDKVKIVSIKPVEKVLMRCLTVDAFDGQFCVGKHFTVTHNTATGITQIMNASNQRLELIARIFAETGVKQLFRHMIKMNQMFITEETFIRVTDQRKPISPDDLAGTIDITVNVGVAAGTKQQQLQNMQLLLQMYPQALQIGIADPSHIAYAFGRIIESMGYKNTSDFVFTPDILKMAEAQGVTPQVMMMMMQQQQTGQTPPALQQYQDNAMRNKLAEVAQTRGLTGSAAQSNQEQQLAQAMAGAGQSGPPQEQVPQGPQNDLTTQQFAQRNAPQPAALSADRRIPAQGG